VIETLQLKEIVMSDRQYMWVGLGDNPTYEKLDRVLVSTVWEHNYPLSTIESSDRNISDHTPLILNTGVSTHQNRQPTFKFERGWLTRDGFSTWLQIYGNQNVEATPLLRGGKTRLETADNI
jgi:hypothetical protein